MISRKEDCEPHLLSDVAPVPCFCCRQSCEAGKKRAEQIESRDEGGSR